jgi:hypothetical protein
LDEVTGCSTPKCICDPHEFTIALYIIAKCISSPSEDKIYPTGCGEDTQQDAAEKVMRKSCSLSGYDVQDVKRATALPDRAPTKTDTNEGTVTVTTVITGAGSAVAKIERQDLGMFAAILSGAMVVSIAIPALMFRNTL